MLHTQYAKPHRPPAPDPDRTKGHRDTSLFHGCRDLDTAYEHLRAHGIAVSPPVVRDYGLRQLSFDDPDGCSICLQWSACGAVPAASGHVHNEGAKPPKSTVPPRRPAPFTDCRRDNSSPGFVYNLVSGSALGRIFLSVSG